MDKYLYINKIIFSNDDVFNDKEFDFRKKDENPAKYIILVGENGSGKTRILKIINLFVNIMTHFNNDSYIFIRDYEDESFRNNSDALPKYFYENNYIKKILKTNGRKKYIINDKEGLIFNEIIGLGLTNYYNITDYYPNDNKIKSEQTITFSCNVPDRLIRFLNSADKDLKWDFNFTFFHSLYYSDEYKVDNNSELVIIYKDNKYLVFSVTMSFNTKYINGSDHRNIDIIKLNHSDNPKLKFVLLNRLSYFFVGRSKFLDIKDIICKETTIYKLLKKEYDKLIRSNSDNVINNINLGLFESEEEQVKAFFRSQIDNIKKSGINFSNYDEDIRHHFQYIRKFENSFNDIFKYLNNDENKNVSIKSISEEKITLSKGNKENNTELNIVDMSTGEKRIIRQIMGYIDNNESTLSPSIFLIDEIDMGLHPKWNSYILDVTRRLLDDIGSQIFITTHSEFIPYSIKHETDILLNMSFQNDKINNKSISSSNYYSIQDFVNQSLKINNKVLIDESNIWVEGRADKKILNFLLREAKEINPFNIICTNTVDTNVCNFINKIIYEYIDKELVNIDKSEVQTFMSKYKIKSICFEEISDKNEKEKTYKINEKNMDEYLSKLRERYSDIDKRKLSEKINKYLKVFNTILKINKEWNGANSVLNKFYVWALNTKENYENKLNNNVTINFFIVDNDKEGNEVFHKIDEMFEINKNNDLLNLYFNGKLKLTIEPITYNNEIFDDNYFKLFEGYCIKKFVEDDEEIALFLKYKKFNTDTVETIRNSLKNIKSNHKNNKIQKWLTSSIPADEITIEFEDVLLLSLESLNSEEKINKVFNCFTELVSEKTNFSNYERYKNEIINGYGIIFKNLKKLIKKYKLKKPNI